MWNDSISPVARTWVPPQSSMEYPLSSTRRSANLQDAHGLAVFFSEELLDIVAFLRFQVRNFRPRNRRVLADLIVHQIFDLAFLPRSQGAAAEIEGELVRTDITSLLGRVR